MKNGIETKKTTENFIKNSTHFTSMIQGIKLEPDVILFSFDRLYFLTKV